jgi:hypothetical protein
VTSPGLLAFDLGCRGAAAGLFLMVAGVLLRDRPGNARVRLRAALAAAAAAFAIRSAPGFPADWRWWSPPLLALSWSAPPLFWLWARAMFDDDFEFAPRHAIAWAAFVACGLSLNLGFAPWPGSGAALGRALSLAILGLALLGAGQTLATWRADLIAGRRRLRSRQRARRRRASLARDPQRLGPVPRGAAGPAGGIGRRSGAGRRNRRAAARGRSGAAAPARAADDGRARLSARGPHHRRARRRARPARIPTAPADQ